MRNITTTFLSLIFLLPLCSISHSSSPPPPDAARCHLLFDNLLSPQQPPVVTTGDDKVPIVTLTSSDFPFFQSLNLPATSTESRTCHLNVEGTIILSWNPFYVLATYSSSDHGQDLRLNAPKTVTLSSDNRSAKGPQYTCFLNGHTDPLKYTLSSPPTSSKTWYLSITVEATQTLGTCFVKFLVYSDPPE